MRNFFLAILATVGLGASANATNWEAEYLDQYARYTSWTVACELTPYSCIGVEVPKVVRVKMRKGLLGYYDGGDSVFINIDLMNGIQTKEVLVHEMIHYLQAKVGGLKVPGPAEPICRAEEEAFTLVDKWLLEIGYKNMVVGPNWWYPYQHCWPYYNPNYTVWDWLKGMVEDLFFPYT